VSGLVPTLSASVMFPRLLFGVNTRAIVRSCVVPNLAPLSGIVILSMSFPDNTSPREPPDHVGKLGPANVPCALLTRS